MNGKRENRRKHRTRKNRRKDYERMLDLELPDETAFRRRIRRSIDRDGMDIAHDGRPIRARLWRYMQERERTDELSARACLHHVEKVIRSMQPSRPG